MHMEGFLSFGSQKQLKNQRSIYFCSAGFPNVNAPEVGAPNPNAAGVGPFCPCPCPVDPKLNGDPGPAPVDVEGVGGVNTNAVGLVLVVPFVVTDVVVLPGVLDTPKDGIGLSIAGEGVSGVVVAIPNALTGVDVVPKALPFVNGWEPGLGASCWGTTNGDTLGDAPVVEFEDGKVTFESDPPAGLFAAKLKVG